MRTLPLALVAVLSLPPVAGAAEMVAFRDAPGLSHVMLRGEITDRDPAAFRSLVAKEASEGRRVYAVSLDSPGGDAWAGFAIARTMRASAMAASVEGANRCNSSCFTLLAFGRDRFVSPRADVYVHRVSIAGGDNQATRAGAVDMAVAYKAVGVPDSVLGAMVTTPHDKAYRLTLADFAAMGVAVTPDGRPSPGWIPPAAGRVGAAAPEVDRQVAALAALDAKAPDRSLLLGLAAATLVAAGAGFALAFAFLFRRLRRALAASKGRVTGLSVRG